MSKNTEKKIKGFLMAAVTAVISLTLLNPIIAHAGEINGAEQKLIDAVSGSFSYDGKTYIIKSSYVAQISSKLSEDGVDLSEADAGSYIAQFKNSYEELVEEGYCNETGGNLSGKEGNKKDDTSGSGSTSRHSQDEKERNKIFIRTILGKPQNSVSDASGDRKSNKTGQASDGEDKSDENSDAETEWEEEQDLGVSFDFRMTDMYAAQQKKTVFKAVDNKYELTLQQGSDKTENGNPINRIIHIDILKQASYIILGISAVTVTCILLYIVKVKRRGRKKRGLRCFLAVLSGVAMAGCASMLLLVLGLYFGVYNKSAIHRQLMESDYYSGITQMTRELATQTLEDAGLGEDDISDLFSMSHIYIEEKQYIDRMLSGDSDNEISAKKIETQLEEKLADMKPYEKTFIISNVTNIYRDVLNFETGDMIRQSMDTFMPWCYVVMAVGLAMLISLFALTFIMYGYLHKAARVSAAGIFVPSVAVTAFAAGLRLREVAEGIETEPVYYGQFIQKYVNWSVNAVIYVGCIGILTAVALYIWKRYLRNIYVGRN